MDASVLRTTGRDACMTPGYRAIYWACCAWAVAAMWLAPHLPQVDLPQHAGQVALLHEYALGRTPWSDELRVNLTTPYLIGYLALLALSFVTSVEHAIAVVYSLSFVAFVAACISLRKELQADERLDWLFLPGFFGLAWQWGFLTFLCAVPIGLYFLTMSYRYAAAPTWRRGLAVIGLGAGLLFAHGLVFLYAVPIGLIVVLAEAIGARALGWRAVLPYAVLFAGFAIFKTQVLDRELDMAPHSQRVIWGELKYRLRALFINPVSLNVHDFPAAPLIVLACYAAPWLLGLRPRPGLRARIPFLWTLVMMLFYPMYVSGATNFYDRFAVVLLPTYAFMFARVPRAGAAPLRASVAMLVMAMAAGTVVARETLRQLHFAHETRGIDEMLARMPPHRKLLYIPLDIRGSLSGLALAHLHYASWYQARHGGLVEFNFATLLPQIVRYRDFRRHIDPDAPWDPAQRMPWSGLQHEAYAYVLYWSATRPGPAMLEADTCGLVLVDAVPGWWLYRNACVP